MRLMKLTEFRATHLVGDQRPSLRTLQRWPGARKCGGEWYIDLDHWQLATVAGEALAELERDPEVAALVGAR